MGFPWDVLTAGVSAGADVVSGVGNLILGGLTNAQNQRNWETQMSREDTAIQRRAADMKAAGLSQTLAAGNAAQSSAPIRLEAPQIKMNPVLAYQEAKKNTLSMKAAETEIMRQKADISRTMAQTAYINAQKRKAEQGIEFAGEMNPLKLAQQRTENQFNQRTLENRISYVASHATVEQLTIENKRMDTLLKNAGIKRMQVQNVVDSARAVLYGINTKNMSDENARAAELHKLNMAKGETQLDTLAIELEAKKRLLDNARRAGKWLEPGAGMLDKLSEGAESLLDTIF